MASVYIAQGGADTKKTTTLDILFILSIILGMKKKQTFIDTIYLDMDGVVADIRTLASALTTWMPWDMLSQQEQQEAQSNLIHYKKDFFQQATTYEHTEKLYKLCRKYALHVRFLSCFTPESEKEFERVAQDKRDWIHKHIDPAIPDSDIIIVQRGKHKYANASSLLIDDNPKNIKRWRDCYGTGIIFKNLNNCTYQLESLNFQKKPCNSNLLHTVLQRQR